VQKSKLASDGSKGDVLEAMLWRRGRGSVADLIKATGPGGYS